jgi:hypothetical protein
VQRPFLEPIFDQGEVAEQGRRKAVAKVGDGALYPRPHRALGGGDDTFAIPGERDDPAALVLGFLLRL